MSDGAPVLRHDASPTSRNLKSECAILAGMARATLPDSKTPWESYVEDYDRIRDTMAQVLPRVRGFQPAGARAARIPDHAARSRAR